MSMRSYLVQSLRDSAALASLGLADAGVLAGAVDTVTLRPFMQLRWMPTQQGFKDVAVRRFLNLWVHDDPNDYTRIDRMLFIVKTLWGAIEGVDHGSGVIILAEWQSDSQDFNDDTMQTIGRFSTWRITGTEGIIP